MFKGRGGHNVKEPDFFFVFVFVFCFFCFGCFFAGGGGGGSHVSQGKRREHKSLPTEYKTGTTEN